VLVFGEVFRRSKVGWSFYFWFAYHTPKLY
jgi:hypothetical protein